MVREICLHKSEVRRNTKVLGAVEIWRPGHNKAPKHSTVNNTNALLDTDRVIQKKNVVTTMM